MFEVAQESLKKANKPYDVVTNQNGDVGFIEEVGVNNGQSHFETQISYSIEWMIIKNERDYPKSAWWSHDELTKHCNIFEKIAECSVHPMGNNRSKVKDLFKNWQ